MGETLMSKFRLPGAGGEAIRGYLHVPIGEGKLPVVLLAHGFKGCADYGFLPRTAEHLAGAGLAVVRFSFSHCGIAENPDSFDRPDLFESDTFGHQISDVLALIEAVCHGRLPETDRLDGERIAMVGHSRGGVTAVLATGATDSLRALVVLSSPDQTLHDPTMRQQLRVLGRISSPSSRTGQQLFVGRAVVDDIDTAGDRYDLPALLGRYKRPLLAVHCQDDLTVPVAAAKRLAEAHTGGPTELLVLPGGSHTFGFAHGQKGSTATLDTVLAKITEFLTHWLM